MRMANLFMVLPRRIEGMPAQRPVGKLKRRPAQATDGGAREGGSRRWGVGGATGRAGLPARRKGAGAAIAKSPGGTPANASPPHNWWQQPQSELGGAGSVPPAARVQMSG